ncbi:MAG TPA: two-component regulator propeller domain-containing protein, partial [Acidobacteriota bacterium]|nr:two-component regulator propeller domain-containing protein [Acidobacteriota bacterium]
MKHIWHLMAAVIVTISLSSLTGLAAVSTADLISGEAESTSKLVFRKSTDVVSSGRPAFKYYTDRQGLPQNAVSSIVMDRRGYLWIGTKDGAAYYNGRIWRTVNLPNRTKSNFVWIIRNAADGGLWFGTSGAGVLHLKDDQWTIYDQTTGLGDDIIHGMVE